MTSPGPLSLIGGGEHLSATKAIDSRLLELTGATRPRVVVLPQAPSRGQMAKTVALARNHWTRLGAQFAVASQADSSDRSIEALFSADIAVIPGGHPNKLVAGLGASRLTDVLTSRWLDGMAVSGSSAGAMCLFEWRIKLYPPNPLRLLPGLGLLDGYVAAPHFDRFRAAAWARKALGQLDGLGVVGLDESTALVGHVGALQVVGEGAVTVLDSEGSARYRSGETASVDLIAGRGPNPEAHIEPQSVFPSRFQVDFEPLGAVLQANGSRR